MSEDENDIQGTVQSDDKVPDMTGVKIAERAPTDSFEKEEREAAKAAAPAVAEGAYICTCNIKGDGGKTFSKGDVYVGKLYPDLLEGGLGRKPSIIPKAEWDKR